MGRRGRGIPSRLWTIVWWLTALVLWLGAFVGPLLLAAAAAAWVSPEWGRRHLLVFGEPVTTSAQQAACFLLPALIGVLGLFYVLYGRKRLKTHARTRPAYAVAVFLVVPLVFASLLAAHYRELLRQAEVCDVVIAAYDAATRSPIPVSVTTPARAPSPLLPTSWSVQSLRQKHTLRATWIAARPTDITVSSPGYLAQAVAVGPSDHRIEVFLEKAR
ncbi:MAG: hypothetical protein ACODAJ_01285 [Planctomycetota bacterium]